MEKTELSARKWIKKTTKQRKIVVPIKIKIDTVTTDKEWLRT